ncbi:UNVERIFIED_CONTAM: hypothetical protein FKN15_058905 [Acipenser sinensis]
MTEAEKVSELHLEVKGLLMSEDFEKVKNWQKEAFHKQMIGGFKETKEAEDGFRKAQKPWAKKLKEMDSIKKAYHAACKDEKLAISRENASKLDPNMNPETMKKLQDRVEKSSQEVQKIKEKYKKSLEELDKCNPQYIENMEQVFEQCQQFEEKRLGFFREVLLEVKKHLDLSTNPSYVGIYHDLEQTIQMADAEEDLKWWRSNNGPGMAMNWPQFEDWSIDLNRSLSKREKKKHTDGITLTGMNQTSEQAAQVTKQSNSCEKNKDSSDEETTNPFSTDTNGNSNPFDEEPSPGIEVSVRALYDYEGQEQDELSFKAVSVVFLYGSTELDSNWSWFQLRCMQVGGNANATAFFHQYGCTTNDANAKYNSRAAQLYREKIKSLASQATRKQGTDLWLDSHGPSSPTSPQHKEEDFFAVHTQGASKDWSSNLTDLNFESTSIEEQPAQGMLKAEGEPEQDPNVDLQSASPKGCIKCRKTIISVVELGAKKGGLGAQKVSCQTFSEIEKQAQTVDKIREQEQNTKKKMEKEETVVTSLRLAYQDLEIQRKKDDEKMKNFQGKKKEQAERLGMGFSSRSGVSHSVLSDMHTIKQESPSGSKSARKKYIDEEPENEDSGFGSRSSYFDEPVDSASKFFSKWEDSSDSLWKKESSKFEPEPILTSKMSSHDERPTTRRKHEYEHHTSTDDAQKKFGDAKAISSDMYFGKQESAAASYEAKSRLEKFSGNSSISSADLFDEQKKQTGTYGISNVLPTAPDLSQFKQGVKSVAGRLSVMANGVMTSIQVCICRWFLY